MFRKIKKCAVKSLSAILATALLCPMGTTLATRNAENIRLFQECPRIRQKLFCKNISQFSSAAVHRQLLLEIKRYKDRAPDVFEIEEELIKKSDPRSLLIVLSTLNYLFDKCEPFTNMLINCKRKRPPESDNKFTLRFTDLDPTKTTFAFVTPNMEGIWFNCMEDYPDAINRCKLSKDCGVLVPCKPEQILASFTVHEFGHLLTFMEFINEKGDVFSDTVPPYFVSSLDCVAAPSHITGFITIFTKIIESVAESDPILCLLKTKDCYDDKEQRRQIIEDFIYNNRDAIYNAHPESENCKRLIEDFIKYYEYESKNSAIFEPIYNILWECCVPENATDETKTTFARTIYVYKLVFMHLDKETQDKLHQLAIKVNRVTENRDSTFTSYCSTFPDLEDKIKEFNEYSKTCLDYIKTSHSRIVSKLSNPKDQHVSNYGDRDPHENLAEAFANLECQKRDKVTPMAKELEKHLIEIGLLPKEKAKFPEHR